FIFMVPKPIKNAGKFKIPALVYMVTILTMHIAAILRLAEFQGLAFIFVYIGSISFFFSDATIAINQWDKKMPRFGPISMTTYIAAQFFIILGAVFTASL
ncbi:MAG: lysoplasmalogenase family protein, partial [Promethearchaeota archaeon]